MRDRRDDEQMVAVFLLAASAASNLVGTWDARRDYGPDGVPPATRWVWYGTPGDEVQHLRLYVTQGQGEIEAFIRNPESNAGAAVGLRTVMLAGDRMLLRRSGASDVAGQWSPTNPDVLTLNDPGLPGTFTFHRAQSQEAPALYRYRAPRDIGDGWKTASVSSAGIDETALDRIVDGILSTSPALHAPYVQSLLVARHGRLVVDEYFNGYDVDRPHDVRSAGKSVTALLVGRAIEDGASFSPSTPIASILTQYQPFRNDDARKQAITVGNLMAMSAGYACDDNDDSSPGNEDRMQSQSAQPDWYRYTLDLPMLFPPGTRALYCSAEINLLGAVVARETQQRLTDYFEARFAKPMEFRSYGMWLMPPPVSEAYMAGGDRFLPRDFLKFGQLFLDRGRWNGRQVVDPAWLATVSAKHSFVEDGGGDYGYGWHLASYSYRGRTIRAINAGGNGGQLLYVFPDLDLTVMITAANYGQFPVWSRYEAQLIPQILQAVS